MPEFFNEFVKWLIGDFNRIIALIAVSGGLLTAIFAPLIRFPLQLRAVRNQEKIDNFNATIVGLEALGKQKDERIEYLEGLQENHDKDRDHWFRTRAQLSAQIDDLHSRLQPWPDTPTDNAIIIVVEDDNASARTICRVLQRMQLEAFVTTRGHDALRHLRSGQFRLMILDFGLPDINGIEVAILARRQGIDIPIIGLTGVAIYLPKDSPQMLEAKFSEVLPKTSRADEIMSAVRRALEMASGGAGGQGKG